LGLEIFPGKVERATDSAVGRGAGWSGENLRVEDARYQADVVETMVDGRAGGIEVTGPRERNLRVPAEF
jgi:hypothetical protein